uniref:Uncharacterized protein n=1 Tax=Cucumis sativus TaxID=3659 RepID=A0A0A0KYK6_CUCSA
MSALYVIRSIGRPLSNISLTILEASGNLPAPQSPCIRALEVTLLAGDPFSNNLNQSSVASKCLPSLHNPHTNMVKSRSLGLKFLDNIILVNRNAEWYLNFLHSQWTTE